MAQVIHILLNETFDEDYTEEIFKSMCFLREKKISDAKQNITSAQTHMKADYDKKNGKPKEYNVGCLIMLNNAA